MDKSHLRGPTRPLAVRWAAVGLMLAITGCTSLPSTQSSATTRADQASCLWTARKTTAMRGTSAMQQYDAFDIYTRCMREKGSGNSPTERG